MFVNNTVSAALSPPIRSQWAPELRAIQQQAAQRQAYHDHAFFGGLLSILDRTNPQVTSDNPYLPHLQRTIGLIQQFDPSTGAPYRSMPQEVIQDLAQATLSTVLHDRQSLGSWRAQLVGNHQQAWSHQALLDAAFVGALTAICDGQRPQLPGYNPYAGVVEQLNHAIASAR